MKKCHLVQCGVGLGDFCQVCGGGMGDLCMVWCGLGIKLRVLNQLTVKYMPLVLPYWCGVHGTGVRPAYGTVWVGGVG